MRLGQNFLVDANLLEAIARDAELEPADVALEIGGGEGALTERLAPLAGSLELAGGPGREAVRAALGDLGHPVDARAEALAPTDFAALAGRLGIR